MYLGSVGVCIREDRPYRCIREDRSYWLHVAHCAAGRASKRHAIAPTRIVGSQNHLQLYARDPRPAFVGVLFDQFPHPVVRAAPIFGGKYCSGIRLSMHSK